MSKSPVIVIVMATMIEAEPFIEALGVQKIEDKPFQLYQRDDMILIISGIGKANAAMATALCCQRFEPDWICNVGAAGATGASCPLGAIYHVRQVTEYDRPLFQSNSPRIYTADMLRGFQTATLATQDKPVITDTDRQKMSSCADLVDMEAAAVAQACKRFHTRCLLFKFVSDTPEHPEDDIAKQIKNYGAEFCQFFVNSVLPLLRAT